MHLYAAVHHPIHHLGAVGLDHRNFALDRKLLIDAPGTILNHAPGRIDIDGTFREHELNRLMLGNRPAKSLALFGVFHRLL